jgi:putative ABC transport system permease protein
MIMSSVWQDVRYGLRGLRNQLSFTVLAVLALALGSGAATTIFSVIQNVLLDPFPYTNAERVVAITIHDLTNSRPGGRTAFQLAEFLDYQEQNHVFDEVIGGGGEDILMTNGEGTEQFDGGTVTPNTFRFLGVPALLGRVLGPTMPSPARRRYA